MLNSVVIPPQLELELDGLFKTFETPEEQNERFSVVGSAIIYQSPLSLSIAGMPRNSSIASSGLSAFICLAL